MLFGVKDGKGENEKRKTKIFLLQIDTVKIIPWAFHFYQALVEMQRTGVWCNSLYISRFYVAGA